MNLVFKNKICFMVLCMGHANFLCMFQLLVYVMVKQAFQYLTFKYQWIERITKPLKETDRHTEKRRSCEDRSRDWRDAATSPETPGAARGWSGTWRQLSPANTLSPDFCPPELWANKYLLTLPHHQLVTVTTGSILQRKKVKIWQERINIDHVHFYIQ